MGHIDFTALDELAGEVLPERAVLGVVSTPFNNTGAGDGGSSSSSAAAAGGSSTTVVDAGNHGATALSACQSTNTPGTPGLVGTLGLGSANPSSTITCTPAAVSSY